MKRLLPLLSACLASFAACAQNNSDLQKFSTKIEALPGLQRYSTTVARKDTAKELVNPKLFLSNPKPGVHRLPLDNMPCIVPEPLASVTMPNAWKGRIEVPFRSKEQRMPNPAKPLIMSPSRPLLKIPDVK